MVNKRVLLNRPSILISRIFNLIKINNINGVDSMITIYDVLKNKPRIMYSVSNKIDDIFEVNVHKRTGNSYIIDKRFIWRDIPFQNDTRRHVFNQMTKYDYRGKFIYNPYDVISDYAFKYFIGIRPRNFEKPVFEPIEIDDTPILKDVCREMREFSDRMVSWTDVDYIVKTQRW